MKVDTSHLAQDDASSHEFSNIMHVGDFVDQGSPDGYVRVVVISAADWEIEQARVAALEADAIGLAAAHIQRGAGRPPRDGGTVPTTLRLTERERDALAALGDGDMTAGLRAALATLSYP